MDALVSHEWYGNVRELENVVERAMILAPGPVLELGGMLPVLGGKGGSATAVQAPSGESLQDVERAHVLAVLDECHWKVRGEGGAAERLGLNRSTLQSRMKKLGIRRPTV